MEIFHWGTVQVNRYLDSVFARHPDATLVQAVLLTLLGFVVIYVSFAGSAWLAVRRSPPHSMINPRALRPGQLLAEVKASVVTIAIFGLLAGMTFSLLRADVLHVTGAVSLGQWLLEILALYVWNEVHFYAAHRLLHLKKLMNWTHIEHHRSVIVTPFAVYRFHWFEALLLGLVMPLAMALHNFSIWSLFMLPPLSLAWNVLGHSNWQTKQRGLGWLARASQRHAQHHEKPIGNFGFSLPYLDRWFGTVITPQQA